MTRQYEAMSDVDIASCAERLDVAQTTVTAIPQLTADRALTVEDAYAIQAGLVSRRVARGELVTGVKLGFTDRAKLEKIGASDIIVGRLTDRMRVRGDDVIDRSSFINAKVEPELAVRLSRDLDPDTPIREVSSYLDAVAPAIEVFDLRFEGGLTYEDVVADNSAAAAYAVGEWVPVHDISNLRVWLRGDSGVIEGSTSAVLEGPLTALEALLAVAQRRRIVLRRGDTVLTGAAADPVALEQGRVTCEVAGVGAISINVA